MYYYNTSYGIIVHTFYNVFVYVYVCMLLIWPLVKLFIIINTLILYYLQVCFLYIYIYIYIYIYVYVILSFGTHYKCTFSALLFHKWWDIRCLSCLFSFIFLSFQPFFIVGSCGVKQVLLCFNVSFYFFTKPKHLCCMGPLRMMNEHLMVSIIIYWLWNDFLTKLSDCHLYCSSHCVGLSSKLIVLGHSKCCVSINFLPLKSKLCVEQ